MWKRERLVQRHMRGIMPVHESTEHDADIGMIDWFAAVIGFEVPLRDIGDVVMIAIVGKQMVERLLFIRAVLLWDREIPFFAVGESGIDIKDHSAKAVPAVPDDLSESIFGLSRLGRLCHGALLSARALTVHRIAVKGGNLPGLYRYAIWKMQLRHSLSARFFVA